MKKEKLGAKTFLYPMPTVLVGARVKGKPNYLTVAYCGIMNHDPALIAVAINKSHYTNRGIRENNCFSVNIPSTALIRQTDFCGIFSGARVDKSAVFASFYGKLKKAPMAEECPVNLECRLRQIIPFSMDEVFIGEIVQAYAHKKFLSGKTPDIKKIDPILFSMHDYSYWAVGRRLGKAWSIGEKFKIKPR
jgi:flavin reductase (DIM6/NTAB) family NADH-FMN oxidoreductase RutF